MPPPAVHRLPFALETAVQRVKAAMRGITERTVESLGLAALAAHGAAQRDALLEAQFELNRKSAIFALAFNDAFDDAVRREAQPRDAATGATDWGALSLVDDHEMERKVASERFAMDIAHGCEWELRDLEGYIAAIVGPARPGEAEHRNPLRPELIADAVLRGIEGVSAGSEVRRVLTAEFGRSLANSLRGLYQDVIAEMRGAGVQPVGPSVKQAASRAADSTRSGAGFEASVRGGEERPSAGASTRGAPLSGGMGGMGGSTRAGTLGGAGAGTLLGQVDPRLMSLMRRLAFTEGGGGAGWEAADTAGAGVGAPLPNVIRAHREELRQASGGALDHMVIDVVGSLFDQILSDPKVPPQMARQIARLQLPVLRAALGDRTFFSSRRHPVRRFVNRIASLGVAFEDFTEDPGRALLEKVRELVQQVVDGDFDQIEVYEGKLTALEQFVAEQGRREVDAQGDAAEMLAAKEDELRLRALYAQQLQSDLQTLEAPEFLREFMAGTWSQVLLQASTRDGPDSDRFKRLRQAGRELFMSVQPKTSPAHRKTFLAELPRLMQELKEGLDLIRWPDDRRKAFFGLLLPAHANSLKAQPLRPLDFNMMARQVDNVLEKPQPTRATLKTAPQHIPVLTDEVVMPAFSAEEAARIGLVAEAAVDWNGKVDIDLGEEAPPQPEDVAIPGLPTAGDPAELLEPTGGRSLLDNLQIGFAYQMHLEGGWQKVRLTHVSPGRNFFVFTHGKRNLRTVSLTLRMLTRLCETGRLRAFESAYLLERATARARKQLSALRPA